MFNFMKKKAELKKEDIDFVDDKYVIVTVDGKSSIKLRKDYEYFIVPSALVVMANGKRGLISSNGKELIPMECDDIRIDGDEVVILRNGKLEKFLLSELLKEEN